MHKKFVISILILSANSIIARSNIWDITEARLLRKPIAITKNGDGYFPTTIQFTYRDKDNKLCVGGLHIDDIDHDTSERILRSLKNNSERPYYEKHIKKLKEKINTSSIIKLLWRGVKYEDYYEIEHYHRTKRILEIEKQLQPIATTSWKILFATHPRLVDEILGPNAYPHFIHRIREYTPNPRVAVYRLAELNEKAESTS